MVRLVVAVALTVAFVSFAMGNTHHVTLSFVVGKPVRVRMIFLLLSTFLIGVTFSMFVALVKKARLRRRARLVRGSR